MNLEQGNVVEELEENKHLHWVIGIVVGKAEIDKAVGEGKGDNEAVVAVVVRGRAEQIDCSEAVEPAAPVAVLWPVKNQ